MAVGDACSSIACLWGGPQASPTALRRGLRRLADELFLRVCRKTAPASRAGAAPCRPRRAVGGRHCCSLDAASVWFSAAPNGHPAAGVPGTPGVSSAHLGHFLRFAHSGRSASSSSTRLPTHIYRRIQHLQGCFSLRQSAGAVSGSRTPAADLSLNYPPQACIS